MASEPKAVRELLDELDTTISKIGVAVAVHYQLPEVPEGDEFHQTLARLTTRALVLWSELADMLDANREDESDG